MLTETETLMERVPTARDGEGLVVTAPLTAAQADLLGPEARAFLVALAVAFEGRRQELLAARRERQRAFDAGALPDFLPETRAIREQDWRVATIPADLRRRRVEITGPVDRKMIINALNSGADVFMADFEDSNSPTWENVIGGQVNLREAVRRTLRYTSPEGKAYELADKTATLFVRPRGWHLDEKHVFVHGKPISASLFDFGLFFFHNAHHLLDRGTGPYFYLPKIEGHLEARLWNDVFVLAQDLLQLPQGSVRATVLIETLPAAFEMNEILWELRDHSAGLNCGRWDYIFSMIKKLRAHAQFVLSDRERVTMATPFMHNYSLLTIQTCHRRGIHAMGGMSAYIPVKSDPAANEVAMQRVREDKAREVGDGHDGTWVAHPGLVPLAMEAFSKMAGDNQIGRPLPEGSFNAESLLAVPAVPHVTERGIRTNISVGIQYLESWLRGQGCVPINNLMEDAATAEISRAQLWQWVHHFARTPDDEVVTLDAVEDLMDEELAKIRDRIGPAAFDAGRFNDAHALFRRMTASRTFDDFLTTLAYEQL